jgi:ribosomal protein S18 acetylase RimI-like enzyme
VTETFEPLTEGDFEKLRDLAICIWHEHYGPILAREQIDYMIEQRYTAQSLGTYIGASDRWLWLARADGTSAASPRRGRNPDREAIGYFSYASIDRDTIKLEQLYVEAAERARGIGSRMLEHVEAHARELGTTRVVLTVNKRNAGPIAFYEKRGYRTREATTVDIGGGFFMDDYVMEKVLGA